MLSDTDTGTFFGTNFFRYRFRDFFPVPNFTDIGSDTTRQNEKFPVPVPIRYRYPLYIFKITKFCRYRFRYFFRYQIFPIPVPRLFFRYQIFPIPVPKLFPAPNFSDTTRKNEKFPVPVPVSIINVLDTKI